MRPSADLERTILRLRFSLMLAAEREGRVQLVPTWRSYDDPLSQGYNLSWSDPRQGTGIIAVQLTDEEVGAWGEWYARLSTAHVDRIELGLTRTMRAIAERREPSDVLVDSVIAWESMFGSRQGEPTLRVTTSMAKLLETTDQAREQLRRKLVDIYSLRSDIVHGNRHLKESEYAKCQEALDLAVRAIRVLVTDRTDILKLTDGAARSNALLLGS
jgi:Apea-like HEPN